MDKGVSLALSWGEDYVFSHAWVFGFERLRCERQGSPKVPHGPIWHWPYLSEGPVMLEVSSFKEGG